jgi:nicotinamide mononucleotide transporter
MLELVESVRAFLGMTGLELIASALGIACVVLTARRNIWCWPTGIAMVTIYAYIFYEAKLYSDALLQVAYFFLQFYGWHFWLHGGPREDKAPIARLSRSGWAATLGSVAAGTAALGYSMATYTDASFPYWDAFTTAASLAAQWHLGRKILENWYVWIAVDMVCVPLYFAKELRVTSGLYAVFLVLATLGLLAWKKALRNQEAA